MEWNDQCLVCLGDTCSLLKSKSHMTTVGQDDAINVMAGPATATSVAGTIPHPPSIELAYISIGQTQQQNVN